MINREDVIKVQLASMIMIVLAGCGHKEPEVQDNLLPPVEVRTYLAEERDHTRVQWLPGTIHPVEQAIVASKLMATVARVDVTIGQDVAAGDILVYLSADEVNAQVEQAEAYLAQIERNYEREKGLLRQSATTAEAVRTLEDQIRLAKAELSEAQTMESYELIKAPFDGMVTSKQIRRGDLATPGMPLLTIEGNGKSEVHVQVPDSLSALPYGTKLTIEADGHELETILSEWSPAADPASRSRLVKLTVEENSPVRSGQYVRVRWPAGETSSVWIPLQSLSRLGQLERVFTIDDGKLHLHLVKTGSRENDWVQILSGINAGDEVVLSPESQFRDGQPVHIQQ